MSTVIQGTPNANLLEAFAGYVFGGGPNLQALGVYALLSTAALPADPTLTLAECPRPDTSEYGDKICVPYLIKPSGPQKYKLLQTPPRAGHAVSGVLTWFYLNPLAHADELVYSWGVRTGEDTPRLLSHGQFPTPLRFSRFSDEVKLTPRLGLGCLLHLTGPRGRDRTEVDVDSWAVIFDGFFPPASYVARYVYPGTFVVDLLTLRAGGVLLGPPSGRPQREDLAPAHYPGYALQPAERVTLDLVDVAGRTVRLRPRGAGDAGPQEFAFRPPAELQNPQVIRGYQVSARLHGQAEIVRLWWVIWEDAQLLTGPADSVTLQPQLRLAVAP